ncbi:MAG: DUF3572 domain-containing protein [Alphaproteobacteria bacterium]|nr:DUF3572 domain-containing protein [Alphaproteobacteria bacterium]
MTNRPDSRISRSEAELLALSALQFIAMDMPRLERFLKLTGLDPSQLRASAGDSAVMTAVLGFLMDDESLLLMFSANAGIPPEHVASAQLKLGGSQPEWGC